MSLFCRSVREKRNRFGPLTISELMSSGRISGPLAAGVADGLPTGGAWLVDEPPHAATSNAVAVSNAVATSRPMDERMVRTLSGHETPLGAVAGHQHHVSCRPPAEEPRADPADDEERGEDRDEHGAIAACRRAVHGRGGGRRRRGGGGWRRARYRDHRERVRAALELTVLGRERRPADLVLAGPEPGQYQAELAGSLAKLATAGEARP